MIGDHWNHRSDGSIAHERKADHDEIGVRVVNSPVNCHEHADLDAKNNGIDLLEVVVVQQTGPEHLETSVEKGAA